MSSADSPGLSTSETNAAVCICDLDGTLLSVNSFPYWALYMLAGHFSGMGMKERLSVTLAATRILLARKMRRRNHGDTKRLLQILWAESIAKDPEHAALHSLQTILQQRLRPNVRPLLAAIKEGRLEALLATAAAGEYAQELGHTLGFTHVLTTPRCTEADNLENCRERKRDRVLAALETLGWHNRPRVLLTDHEEDLPLMHACQRTLWFGRYEEMDELQERVPEMRLIFARNAPDVEILRLAGYR